MSRPNLELIFSPEDHKVRIHQDRTELLGSLLSASNRATRKAKDRRGPRWLRGHLHLEFPELDDDSCEELSGEISISRNDKGAFHIESKKPSGFHGDRGSRHATRKPSHERLNSLFSRLPPPAHQPFEDFTVKVDQVQGSKLEYGSAVLSVTSALVQSGYPQKDVVVSENVVVKDGQFTVGPRSSIDSDSMEVTEDGSQNPEPIESLVELDYLASSNRIGSVHFQGQLSTSELKKAVALGLRSCQDTATNIANVYRRNYDECSRTSTKAVAKTTPVTHVKKAAGDNALPDESLKASFQSMLSSSSAHLSKGSGNAPVENKSAAIKVNISSSLSNETPANKGNNTGKKLSLADLAKSKKK